MAIDLTASERQLLRAKLNEKFGGIINRFAIVDFILGLVVGEIDGTAEVKALLSETLTELQDQRVHFDEAKAAQEASLDMSISDTTSVIGKLEGKPVEGPIDPLPIAPMDIR